MPVLGTIGFEAWESWLLFMDFHWFASLSVKGLGSYLMQISVALLENLRSEAWEACQAGFSRIFYDLKALVLMALGGT